MYKISVPIMNLRAASMDREKLLCQLKSFDAERVFLALEGKSSLPEYRTAELKALNENCAYFKAHGLEVGAWLWAFMYYGGRNYAHLRSPEGNETENNICPADENYRKFMSDYIEQIASTGVDLIMFDDDYRYGFHGNDVDISCTCKYHMAMIRNITGDNISEKELCKYIRTGAPNKYRDAFVKANGIALEGFSAAMRKAVDRVDKNIRLGFCACITSWDIDGTNPDRISRILAGDTKPFYRLIGAPYWAARRAFGARLGDVIEYERLEASRRKDKNIEIFAEGDTYPRPRFQTPASFLEGFDTALRASGATDGILKYGMDYTSLPDYETAYAEFHKRNRDVYKKIDKLFTGTSLGIRIYSKPLKMTDMIIPEGYKLNELSFPYPARMLTPNGIPITYEGLGTSGIAFGADVDAVPKEALNCGMILDAAACERLAAAGTDIGIEEFCGEVNTDVERYRADSNRVAIAYGAKIRKLKISAKAEIISEFETADGLYPASFRYENEDGQRFLIFAFDGYLASEWLFRTYARGITVINSVEWLCGKKLPVSIKNSPDIYTLVRCDNNKMTAGIWNFSADTVFDAVISLDGDYKITDTINCSVTVKNGKAYPGDIPPFGFIAFECEKI